VIDSRAGAGQPIEILGLDRKNVVTKPEKYNAYNEQ
jgi:hypothetical protein